MTSRSRRKHQITVSRQPAKAIRIRSLIPSRESLLAAVFAGTALLPSLTQAEPPQPSLFRESTAAGARPIREAVDPAGAQWVEVRKRRIGGSTTALRWQSPRVVSRGPAAFQDQSAAHVPATVARQPEKPKQVANKALVWGQDDRRATSSQIRLVTHLGQIDPFDDPFGDRGTQFEEPRGRTFISQPEDAQPLPDAAPQPFAPQNDPPLSLPPEADPQPAPLDDLAPEPEMAPDDTLPPPVEPNDRGFRDPRIPRSQPYQPPTDCDKIYNERDCCADSEQCQKTRRDVRQNTIDKISLNISPLFKPDASNQADAEQAQALRLAQSPIRSWRNREGQVIARGQFTDLQSGRVYIEAAGKVEKIPVRELSDDDWCFLAAWWGVPTECSLGDSQFEDRAWLASTLTWKASGLCHKPLYFEQVQLERYGHSAGPVLQPALSGAHFFLNIAALPYNMGISPANECEYALGYYRPGNCAPWLLPPLPLSVRGALMEAGAITGGIFVIP